MYEYCQRRNKFMKNHVENVLTKRTFCVYIENNNKKIKRNKEDILYFNQNRILLVKVIYNIFFL